MEKRNMRKLVRITAIVAAGAIVLAVAIGLLGGLSGRFGGGPWLKGRYEVERKESVSATGVERIEVQAVSSDLVVVEGAGGLLEARLTGTAGTDREEALPRLEVRREADRILVRVEHRPTLFFAPGAKLVLRVLLPQGYSQGLALSTVSGGIEVADGVWSALELKTTSGEMQVGAVKADSVAARSVSGDLLAASIEAGSLMLGSTSGELRIAALSGDLQAKTVSGRIDLSWSRLDNAVSIESTSGDIRLRLPAESSFRLEARSTSGRVRCAFPIVLSGGSPPDRQMLIGEVGSGSHPVRIRTVSGDIEIDR
jgi:lia operon protein LiaG